MIRRGKSGPKHRWFNVVRNHRGQALVEAGIVMTFMLVLSLGVVNFGRAFMVSNMITHALRDGARAASVVPMTQRDDSGFITDTTTIKTRVKDIMLGALDSTTVNSLTLNVTQQTENGVNTVKVAVAGNIPYAIKLPGLGTTFPVNRSVSFRDEGR